ncbi:MAG: TOBE domain-containing protein [Desulfitobacteriaceae bacterium]
MPVRPEDIRLDSANGMIRGRIVTSVYRGNLIE